MTQDPFVGRVIDGRYEIQARIGEGGMGVVYRARQISIDRVIALKMLNQEMASDQNWVQRFYNEAKACSRLQHPNTIRMFDFGQTQDGRLFMTMEFLDGASLRDVLQRGPLAPQRVIKILIQCCASLAEAHSIGIIHRDIKPDNVFLLNMAGSPDFVKLLDFSVAKLLEGERMKTQAGVVFGTPQYMSPEQGRGMPLDPRSDLYALGILAFEMLTGKLPFDDANPMNVIKMHMQAQVPPMPASIPYPVQMVVRRALEKDVARRYQSSGEMMQHCQQVFAELNAGSVSVGGGGVPRTMIAGPPQQMPQGMAPGYGPPPQMGGRPQMGGPQPHGAQAKTMIAQPSPFAQGGPPGAMPGPGPGAPQPYQALGAAQKTIVAGMAQPMIPGQMHPGQMPPGQMPPGQMPPGQMHPGQMHPGQMHPGQMHPGQMHPGQMPPGQIHPGQMPPGQIHPGQMPPGQIHPGQMHPGQMHPHGTPNAGFPPQPGGPGAPNRTMLLPSTEGVVSVARHGARGSRVAGGSPAQGASTLYWIVCLFAGIAIGVLAYVIVLQV